MHAAFWWGLLMLSPATYLCTVYAYRWSRDNPKKFSQVLFNILALLLVVLTCVGFATLFTGIIASVTPHA